MTHMTHIQWARFAPLVSLLPPHPTLQPRVLSVLIGTIIQKNEEHFGYQVRSPLHLFSSLGTHLAPSLLPLGR